MSLIASIRSELSSYIAQHSDEKADLAALLAQISEEPDTILNRSNMRGHITTSILVVDESGTHGLVIEHLQFKRWLQPGGHYDGDVSLQASALREAMEETGVTDVRILSDIPLDIDTHVIGARPAKGEGEHLHHDFCYLGQAPRMDLTAQESEVSGARWVALTELARTQDRLGRMSRKGIQQMELRARPQFRV